MADRINMDAKKRNPELESGKKSKLLRQFALAAAVSLGVAGVVGYGLTEKADLSVSPLEPVKEHDAAALFPTTLSAQTKDGHIVTMYQGKLEKLGYLPSYGVDGTYGQQTASATMRFQKDHNLPVTGDADTKTRWLLHNLAAEKMMRQQHVQLKARKP